MRGEHHQRRKPSCDVKAQIGLVQARAVPAVPAGAARLMSVRAACRIPSFRTWGIVGITQRGGTVGHRLRRRYQRSALPTFAHYTRDMVKVRLLKRHDDRRISKPSADARDRDTTEPALPPKKPRAPSAKHRLKRSRRAKLLK